MTTTCTRTFYAVLDASDHTVQLFDDLDDAFAAGLKGGARGSPVWKVEDRRAPPVTYATNSVTISGEMEDRVAIVGAAALVERLASAAEAIRDLPARAGKPPPPAPSSVEERVEDEVG